MREPPSMSPLKQVMMISPSRTPSIFTPVTVTVLNGWTIKPNTNIKNAPMIITRAYELNFFFSAIPKSLPKYD